MLPTRLRPVPTPNTAPSTEDIFQSALSTLFTDDTRNSHGIPGGILIYASPAYGDIVLSVPAYPEEEEERKLFAHYLWNPGVVVAEGVERAAAAAAVAVEEGDQGWGWGDWKWWDVKGKSVLEVGAGTALPSIICAKAGAACVTITDHTSSPALTTGAIKRNLEENLKGWQAQVEIRGHVWGEESVYDPEAYGKVVGRLGRYDRVVVADCLWMPSQHAALVRTIGRGLVGGGKGNAAAIVVAGFHTGRAVVRDFFDVATGMGGGLGGESLLKIEEIFEEDFDGARREWERERLGENREEAKRWCVVAILTLA